MVDDNGCIEEGITEQAILRTNGVEVLLSSSTIDAVSLSNHALDVMENMKDRAKKKEVDYTG